MNYVELSGSTLRSNNEMKETIDFDKREEFEKFEKENPEIGLEFGDVEFYTPIDLSIKAFMDLQWIGISFEPYDHNPLFLKFSSKTNELLIGDIITEVTLLDVEL
ncbi:MAG: hypothetical protein GY827_03600 [Cytophagales bacterium]|nr:hypothetical protein [Cytophagales bacterium]